MRTGYRGLVEERRQRQTLVFALRCIDHMTGTQIASRLGVSKSVGYLLIWRLQNMRFYCGIGGDPAVLCRYAKALAA